MNTVLRIYHFAMSVSDAVLGYSYGGPRTCQDPPCPSTTLRNTVNTSVGVAVNATVVFARRDLGIEWLQCGAILLPEQADTTFSERTIHIRLYPSTL